MTIFLLKLSLCWTFFALLYALLLRQETFFRANRIYLLSTAVLGIILAILPGEQMPVPVDEAGIPVLTLPEFTVGIQAVESATNTWQTPGFLWMAYWTGVMIMALRVLWGLLKIVQMARHGRKAQLSDGGVLIQTGEAKVPFSFFKWVFVPDTYYSESMRENNALMLAHERAHAQGWHSVDVLFAEILCVIFWFHPVAHWYRKALRTVHEYLADAEASRQADRKQYGLLLIGQSQSGMPIAFANHFFQSPLKQRLIMLTKKASAPVRAIKFGLVAPLVLLFAMFFRQAPAIAQVVDEKHLQFVRDLESKNWMSTDTIVTFNPETYEETVKIVQNSVAPELDETGKLVYYYAEVQPQFPGGQEALYKFLTANIKYPEIAKAKNQEGTVYISFVVDETGNLLHPRAKYYDEASRILVEEAERVVKSMPNWTPAMHKGKTVRCSVNLPVKFTLAKAAPKITNADPEYPGGMDALIGFLSGNTIYPKAAQAAKAEGMVIVKFMVNEDGSLSEIAHANTDKQFHPDLVKEAIRVVGIMPKWKPAVKDGKVVKTQFSLPIKFKLDEGGHKELNEVDVLPEYPGGLQEMYKFLTTNVKYPEAARTAGVEDLVVITFLVETDGSLSTFESVKATRQDFSDEVIRVMKLSPKWTPANKDGKAVKVKYTLPFKFKLSSDK